MPNDFIYLIRDVPSYEFCGAIRGLSQQILFDKWHDRLKIGLVSIPPVRPGDTVWWHPDLIHAVEGENLVSVVCVCCGEREREREGTSHCCRGEAWRGNYGESQRSREKKR